MHRSDWVTNCLLMPMQVPVRARRSHYAWVKQAVSTSCSFRPCNALNLVSCLLVPPVTGLALFSAFYRPGSVRPQPQLSGLILVPVRVDSQKVEVEAGRAQRNSIGVIALPPAPHPKRELQLLVAPCRPKWPDRAAQHHTGVIILGCASDELEHPAASAGRVSYSPCSCRFAIAQPRACFCSK
jgi:hypothetical protein